MVMIWSDMDVFFVFVVYSVLLCSAPFALLVYILLSELQCLLFNTSYVTSPCTIQASLSSISTSSISLSFMSSPARTRAYNILAIGDWRAPESLHVVHRGKQRFVSVERPRRGQGRLRPTSWRSYGPVFRLASVGSTGFWFWILQRLSVFCSLGCLDSCVLCSPETNTRP